MDPEKVLQLALVYVPIRILLFLLAIGIMGLYQLDREAHARNVKAIYEGAQI